MLLHFKTTTSFCFSLDSILTDIFFLSIHLLINLLLMTPYNTSTPSFAACFSLLSCPFNGLHWLVKVAYACRAVCVTCLCVCETEKKHVCVCHSICSYINSHFPPEQTHFPNTHLTRVPTDTHTHTHTTDCYRKRKLL